MSGNSLRLKQPHESELAIRDQGVSALSPDMSAIDNCVPVVCTSGAANLSLATLGFALIDADGKILTASAEFTKLLNVNTDDTRLTLAEKLGTQFSTTAGNLEDAFSRLEESILDIQSNDGALYRLHAASLDNNSRMVVAQKLETDQLDTANSNQSLIDPLTQLGNRQLLEITLANWQPANEQHTLALIIMDLDRFKLVNDTLGHEVGDLLLKLVAKRTQRSARADDIILRLDGSEFVILHAIGNQPSGAEGVAQRLVDMMRRPFLVDGHQINIGANVGISVLGQGTDLIVDMMRHANLALYDAKGSGRGTHRLFNRQLEEQAMERRELEISLRRAMGLKQFSLVYQPQVQLPDGNITGFEALIRWNHEQRGLIPPDQFIPLAEETGEIISIGEWVLRTACIEAIKWPEHLSVAVNVSPIQFQCDRFVDSICSALSYSGLHPSRLEIEITESVLINKTNTALDHLCAIKDMGVSIAMDDFGTGYSSLSYLNDFPFSKIKIDQTFVRGEQTTKSRALVDAIISLGTSLGMKTIAEGVETEDQYRQLATGGCMAAQGYLISRPLHADSIGDFISNNNATVPE